MSKMSNEHVRAAEARSLDNADEVERLRAAIRHHRDQQGDDRCWVDDLVLYGVLPEDAETHADLTLPPKAEFLQSCERYWQQRQCPLDMKATGKTIRQLEDERAALLASCRRMVEALSVHHMGGAEPFPGDERYEQAHQGLYDAIERAVG